MSTPMSPEVRECAADRDHAKTLTRNARGLALSLLASLALWIVAALALVWLLGVTWR